MRQVGELIRDIHSSLLDDSRCAQALEIGRKKFRKQEKKKKSLITGGFKKSFADYLKGSYPEKAILKS